MDEYKYTYRDTVYMNMCENEDEFILEFIRPYCEKIVKHHIPKELIIRALVIFKEEHAEEWDYLLERSEE